MKLLIKMIGPAILLSGPVLFIEDPALLAQVFKLPERALEEQFPGAVVERRAMYLTRQQKEEMDRALGFETEGRMHTFYIARRDSRAEGYGIFDTHRIRTKEQTVFIVVEPDGRVRHVEVISFFEPDEYRSPVRWLSLLEGKRLSDPIQAGRDLPAITGATLTTNAVTRAVRKVLYLQQIHFRGQS